MAAPPRPTRRSRRRARSARPTSSRWSSRLPLLPQQGVRQGRRVGAALPARRRDQPADADASDPGAVPLRRQGRGDQELMADIQADRIRQDALRKTGSKLLMNATAAQPDGSATRSHFERLVTYHPNKQYWAELIAGVQRKPASPDRFARHLSPDARDRRYDQGQRLHGDGAARAAGRPRPPKASRSTSGLRRRRARHSAPRPTARSACDLATRKAEEAKVAPAKEADALAAAKEGTALVNVGFNQATSGQPARGAVLDRQGIAKGGLWRPRTPTCAWDRRWSPTIPRQTCCAA